MAQLLLPMQSSQAAVIPVMKSERHMPVSHGLSAVEKMLSNVNESIIVNVWTLNERKDAASKEESVSTRLWVTFTLRLEEVSVME